MARLREIEVELVDEVEFANTVKGEQDIVGIVTMAAPASKNRKHASRMSRIYRAADFKKQRSLVSALTEEQKNEARKRAEESKAAGNVEEDEKESADEIMSLIECMSTDDDIDCLYISFRTLLENGCGTIGVACLDKDIFELLSFEDARNMCGVYISDFLTGQSQKRKRGGKN